MSVLLSVCLRMDMNCPKKIEGFSINVYKHFTHNINTGMYTRYFKMNQTMFGNYL